MTFQRNYTTSRIIWTIKLRIPESLRENHNSERNYPSTKKKRETEYIEEVDNGLKCEKVYSRRKPFSKKSRKTLHLMLELLRASKACPYTGSICAFQLILKKKAYNPENTD